MARPYLEDEACIASERDFATRLDPTLIDRDSCAVVADASGNVIPPGGGSDDESNNAKVTVAQAQGTAALRLGDARYLSFALMGCGTLDVNDSFAARKTAAPQQ